MGFWEDAGEFLFGTETRKQARENQAQAADMAKQAGAKADKFADEAAAMGKGYDEGARASMGTNAAEYMRKATEAAKAAASQQAAAAAKGAARSQIGAMRTAGMNPAAAAARAGQVSGQNYAGQYGQGMQTGVNQYMQGTQQFAGQGAEMANRRASAMGINLGAGSNIGNVATGQFNQAQQTSQNTMNTIGNIAGAAAGGGGSGGAGAAAAASDERLKKNIKPLPPEKVDEILDNVDPIEYQYKDDSLGEGDQIGVTAQNLEESGLGHAVEDTPGGKIVNGAKLEMANLDMIKGLNDKMNMILELLGGQNGGR